MARRILQFPVRNAFAVQRSHDSLARDTQDHAHRIAEQVEHEIARQAGHLASGRGMQFEAARHGRVTMMRQPSRATRFRGMIASFLRAFTNLSSRPKHHGTS